MAVAAEAIGGSVRPQRCSYHDGPIDTLLFGNQLVSLLGATEQSAEQLAVGHLARAIPADSTAVIADVDEPDPAALDATPGATISRRTYADVERELDAGRESTRQGDPFMSRDVPRRL